MILTIRIRLDDAGSAILMNTVYGKILNAKGNLDPGSGLDRIRILQP